ncbi:hypothetical protein X975_05703, partial [Stegodyphus mimosarum]
MSSAQNQEKRPFSGPNTSVYSEGILFSQVCENSNSMRDSNSDSIASGMRDCANDISVAERSILQPNTSVSSKGIFDSESNQNLERVIVCENSSSGICVNSDSVMIDMVD